MKTLISTIVVVAILIFFSQPKASEKPRIIDYDNLIYTTDIKVKLKKESCEKLKAEVKLLQFEIKNNLGIVETK